MASRRTIVGGMLATIVPLPALAKKGSAVVTPPVVLEAAPGSIAIETKAKTKVWAYSDRVPGPLLRIEKGAAVAVRLLNKLEQPTTLCWHGVRIANAMDGVAGLTQKPVLPGARFDYLFTPPDAGLYWYHPHVWPFSAEQIGRGLYGVLIVDETEPPAVDQDLLVTLDDWSLDADGQTEGGFLDPDEALHAGRIGSLITVNTKPVPVTINVRPNARMRLRLLNACSARIAIVSFVDMQATVIAIDGQPSEIFQPARATIPIGPGSRFEFMIDLAASSKAASLTLHAEDGSARTLMIFNTAGAGAPAHRPVARLPDNALLPSRIPLERSLRRDVVIGGGTRAVSAPAATLQPFWTLNGVASDGFSGKPLFRIRRGAPVTLTFINKTAFPQQMHVHGHVWRLLHDLDDGWDPYWRDSVLLAPGRTKHVAFIADNPGRWALESAILSRQVTGLATWFEVT